MTERTRVRSLLIGFGLVAVVSFQNCSGSGKFEVAEDLQNLQFQSVDGEGVEEQLDCRFNGSRVANGDSVTAYFSSTGTSANPCVSERRQCVSGVLHGAFQYASCQQSAAAACLFNAQTIASGSSVTAYQSATVPYGQTCASQSRTCTNGTLSGSYAAGSCRVLDPVAPDISGSWTQGCRAAGSASARQTYSFGGGAFATTVQIFAFDTSCSSQSLVLTVNGGYAVGGVAAGVDNAFKLNLQKTNMTATPTNSTAVFALNVQRPCGLSNWALNVPKDITGVSNCTINGISLQGSTLFTIYRRSGSSLFLGVPGSPGSSTDATADDRRPTTLDSMPFNP